MQSYGSNTDYHSLQSQQLSLTAAYTYSHLIDDPANTTNDGGCQCQNPRNIKAERASSLFDQRHRLVVGYVWNVPFAKNWTRVAGGLASHWSFQGIVTLASGNPFDVLESFDSQNNDGIYERPNLVAGQTFSVPNQGPNLWFDTNAFTPSVLVYGNSPRNPIVGPGKRTFDLSLGKSFNMSYQQGHSLQFRAELFNVFNTPQFANPDANLGDGSFGQITRPEPAQSRGAVRFEVYVLGIAVTRLGQELPKKSWMEHRVKKLHYLKYCKLCSISPVVAA
jgi:hypothetical protein